MTSMRPPCLAWVGPWTPVLFLDSLSHAHRCAVAILVCSSPTSGFDSVAGSSAPRHVNLFGPTTLFQATPFSCSFGTADGHEDSVVSLAFPDYGDALPFRSPDHPITRCFAFPTCPGVAVDHARLRATCPGEAVDYGDHERSFYILVTLSPPPSPTPSTPKNIDLADSTPALIFCFSHLRCTLQVRQ